MSSNADVENCAPIEVEVPEAPSQPGMYDDIPNEVYHHDRADRLCLSSSMVRQFLKTPPAQWKWEREHPRVTSTKYFDLGTLVHTLTLKRGPGFVVIDADSFRTDAAKDERDKAWKNHQTPVLPAQYELAGNMRDALLADEIVGTLLSDSHNERSLYERDPVTGLMLRSRPDSMNDSTGRQLRSRRIRLERIQIRVRRTSLLLSAAGHPARLGSRSGVPVLRRVHPTPAPGVGYRAHS
jgi:hypothetical protein